MNNLKIIWKNIISAFSKRTVSDEHGFQLNLDDARRDKEFMNSFSIDGGSVHRLENFINNINTKGFLSYETGAILEKCIQDNDSDLYTATAHSDNLETIFANGIPCFYREPTLPELDKICITLTARKRTELITTVLGIKDAHSLLGFNKDTNGTVLLKIPKNYSNKDILYFDQENQTYNIKPEFIIGFLPVDDKHNVGELITRENINQQKK